jgi:hypothetical protein
MVNPHQEVLPSLLLDRIVDIIADVVHPRHHMIAMQLAGFDDSDPHVPERRTLHDAREVLLAGDLGLGKRAVRPLKLVVQALKKVPHAQGDGEIREVRACLGDARVETEVVDAGVAAVVVIGHVAYGVATHVLPDDRNTIEEGQHLLATPLTAHVELDVLDVQRGGDRCLGFIGETYGGQRPG